MGEPALEMDIRPVYIIPGSIDHDRTDKRLGPGNVVVGDAAIHGGAASHGDVIPLHSQGRTGVDGQISVDRYRPNGAFGAASGGDQVVIRKSAYILRSGAA